MSNMAPDEVNVILKKALEKITILKQELKVVSRAKNEPIALIGGCCRLPGEINSLDSFWEKLKSGNNSISGIPEDRWNNDKYFHPTAHRKGSYNSPFGGFIKEALAFDELYFGLSETEAVNLDPQQRLLLELSVHALEHAGMPFKSIAKTSTGIFLGLGSDDYGHKHTSNYLDIDTQIGLGTNRALAAGRLAHFLDVNGPVMQLDTSCSSSLLAIHLACQSLRNGECDMALAAGVNLILTPNAHVGFCQIGALSATGQCRTFDKAADGYVRGEGGGVAVFKRYSDAVRDKDNVICLVSGSAVNHDGKSNGLTAPSGVAQESLIRKALKNANLKTEDIQYIEAHGTGTKLGDPIEVNSIGKVFEQAKSLQKPIYIGSVKTNIGHLEAAAGISSFFKTALSLHHGEIPPTLNFLKPNPYISWDRYPISVVTKKMNWPKCKTRAAGVSGFGMSGTNVHCILTPPPNLPERNVNKKKYIEFQHSLHALFISAKCQNALRQLSESYLGLLSNLDIDISKLCTSSILKNNNYKYRIAIIGESRYDIHKKLASAISNGFTKNESNDNYIFLNESPSPSSLLKTITYLRKTLKPYAMFFDQIASWTEKWSDFSLEYYLNKSNDKLPEKVLLLLAIAHFYSMINCFKRFGMAIRGIGGSSLSGEIVSAHFANSLDIKKAVKVIINSSHNFDHDDDFWQHLNSLIKSNSNSETQLIFSSNNSHKKIIESFENSQIVDIDICKIGQNWFIGAPSNIQELTLQPDSFASLMPYTVPNVWNQMIQMLTKAYLTGENVDLSSVYERTPNDGITLPFYPFQKKLFCRKGGVGTRNEVTLKPLTQKKMIENSLLSSGLSEEGKSLVPKVLANKNLELDLNSSPKSYLYGFHWKVQDMFFGTETLLESPLISSVLLIGFNLEELLSVKDSLLEDKIDCTILLFDTSKSVNSLQTDFKVYEQKIREWESNVKRNGFVVFIPNQSAKERAVFNWQYYHLQSLECITRAIFASKLVKLKVIGRGAFPVDRNVPVLVLQGNIWAMIKSIDIEYPEMFAGMLDMCPEHQTSKQLEADIVRKFIINESASESWLALRQHGTVVPRLKPILLNSNVSKRELTGNYLISGGLGDIALKLAKWLVQRGAKNIILVCRNTTLDENVKAALEIFARDGCKVTVSSCDITDKTSVRNLFKEIHRHLKLECVYHLAGVMGSLKPFIESESMETISIINAKVQGTLNLGEQLQKFSIPQFVAFSSIASTWGAKYQVNYASANGFMESYCHNLNTRGIKATCLNWGPWLNTAMAASRDIQQSLLERGIIPLEDESLSLLHDLQINNFTSATIANMDWDIFLPLMNIHKPRHLFEYIPVNNLLKNFDQQTSEQTFLVKELLDIPSNLRQERLQNHLREQLAITLNISENEIPIEDSFSDFGLNSLKAIEFKNSLEDNLGIGVPVSALFDYPTLKLMADYIDRELYTTCEDKSTIEQNDTFVDAYNENFADVELSRLDDKSLESMLIEKLKTVEGL